MEPDRKKIKLLLSAYACDPNRGSEPGVGWNVARELSSRVELSVVTRRNNKMPIEQSGEAWIKNVNWIYWDPPKWLTFWKKGSRGVQLFYIIWQMGVARAIKARTDIKEFDILHHITFGKFWIPSSLANQGVPFIFGPVGGGEKTPEQLLASRSMAARLSEFIKDSIIASLTKFSFVKRFFINADWIFAATEQTLSQLIRLNVKRVSLLPQSGIKSQDFPSSTSVTRVSRSDEISLITASRLIHWKAVDLAIEATALASKSVNVTLTVLQVGGELHRLKKMARELGIADRVIFKGKLEKLSQVHEEIGRADALLHPALHEAFGQACLESLALGTPVICLNWAGPKIIVDDKTGILIEPANKSDTVKHMAQAVITIASEIKNGISRSEACRSRAFGLFEWSKIVDSMIEKYQSVLSEHRSQHS